MTIPAATSRASTIVAPPRGTAPSLPARNCLTSRPAFVWWQAGARVGRQADPLRLAFGRLTVVASPAFSATIGSAVTRRRLAPAYADVAFGTGRVLQADLSRVAVLLVAALLWAVALRHALPSEVEDVGLDGTVRDALPGLAEVSGRAIDERAEVHANTRRRLRNTRIHAVGGPRLDALAVVSWRTIAIVVALARMCLG